MHIGLTFPNTRDIDSLGLLQSFTIKDWLVIASPDLLTEVTSVKHPGVRGDVFLKVLLSVLLFHDIVG